MHTKFICTKKEFCWTHIKQHKVVQNKILGFSAFWYDILFDDSPQSTTIKFTY